MAKQRNFTPPTEEIIPNELLDETPATFGEEVVEGEVTPTPEEKEEEPAGEVEGGEESAEEGEKLDPAAAGCRAFGDTVLVFPSLPEKPFVDYRAEVVQECFRNQPSVMELAEEETVVTE